MKSKLILIYTTFILFFSCSSIKDLEEGLYAEFTTNMGNMIVKLNYESTPVTVANFVLLSEGKHPKVQEKFKGKKFYDGIIFHRVIDSFMIQAGDPTATGSGGPGYRFLDEIVETLKHDKPGILSMANSGPGTNGSQFFITEIATPWLDGKHTVFGQLIKGFDVYDNISNVKTAVANRPEKDVVIKKIKIIRKGSSAKKFDALNTWLEMEPKLSILAEQKRREEIEKISVGYTVTDSGLRYKITKTSNGKSAIDGNKVKVHYVGKLLNGNEFDSSYKRNLPFEFQLGVGQVIKGWDEALKVLKTGEKGTFIIPSELGYGPRGAGGVIPPNATLIFDIELLEIN